MATAPTPLSLRFEEVSLTYIISVGADTQAKELIISNRAEEARLT